MWKPEFLTKSVYVCFLYFDWLIDWLFLVYNTTFNRVCGSSLETRWTCWCFVRRVFNTVSFSLIYFICSSFAGVNACHFWRKNLLFWKSCRSNKVNKTLICKCGNADRVGKKKDLSWDFSCLLNLKSISQDWQFWQYSQKNNKRKVCIIIIDIYFIVYVIMNIQILCTKEWVFKPSVHVLMS